MQDPGGEAFARTGFAGDKQRAEWCRRELGEQCSYTARGCAAANEGLRRVAPILCRSLLAQLALSTCAARRTGHDEVEAFEVAGLLEEVVSTQTQGANGIGH